jgi:hypothetical protein
MHTLLLALALTLQSETDSFSRQVWTRWPDARFVEVPAPCLGPARLERELERLAELYPDQVRVEEVGRSFQGRPVQLLTIGQGPAKVLLWARMHGDEPTATPALVDIAHDLLGHADEPDARAILDGLTLLMVPMLNPDGSAVYRRQNLQDIDINRDALNLATPEGRILKQLRDRHEPILGFNLHDQDRRRTVGDTGVPAALALLAVVGDAQGTLTAARERAQRACSAIVEAVEPFVPGGVARFDATWSPRAFGDNITAWGTPVVLIESGALPPDGGFETLTRLNVVGIMAVLRGLVRDDLMSFDPALYEALPPNERGAWADVVVRGGFLRQPGSTVAYRADLAFNIWQGDRELAGCGTGRPAGSSIIEIGDARLLSTSREVDATGGLVVAPFTVGATGWSARRWLSPETLRDLARLGVGTVVWKVPRRKLEDARTRAESLARADGRAHLRVVTSKDDLPRLVLHAAPAQPASRSLAEIVSALGGDPLEPASGAGDILQLLVEPPAPGSPLPTLRQGRTASFLLLSPAPGGDLDPESTCLTAVFIDGYQALGGPQ